MSTTKLQRVGIALFTLLLASCEFAPSTLRGAAIDGQVLERGTGVPIAGAIVVVTWTARPIHSGFTGESPKTLCYRADSAITDAQGRYHIAAWQQPQKYDVPNGTALVSAYKRGFQLVQRGAKTILMKSFTGSVQDRFNVLAGTDQPVPGEDSAHPVDWCPLAGESRRNLFLLFKAVYDETRELAQTDLQREFAVYWGHVAAATWIAIDPLAPSADANELAEEFYKEYLQ